MRTALVLAVFLPLAPLAVAGPRVDLNQDVARCDVVSQGWENWRVPAGPTASAKFGDVTVNLRAVGPSAKLATGWWKPGFDCPARMASDGVVVAGKLELALSGLAAGKHSLGTYHNTFTDAKPGEITVAVAGGATFTVTPTSQVKHDADAASAFVEFEAAAGMDVLVTLTPEYGRSAVLNGFEIDRPDPARRAAKPEPADEDEHAPEDPVLAWRAAPRAAAHRVYLGTDPKALVFRGETKGPTFPTAALKQPRPVLLAGGRGPLKRRGRR
jgi:hypothetical protein